MRPTKPLLAAIVWAGTSHAQEPLSAIEWLENPAPINVAQPLVMPLGEPPVAEGVVVPEVTVMELDSAQPDAAGLLPASTTGLPASIWQASAADTLSALLARVSPDPLPAIQALYYTLLLAEADAPADSGPDAQFLVTRIDALRRLGAVEAARALIERAGANSPALFDAWLDLALLDGSESTACEALRDRAELTQSYGRRIFCTARNGDWPTAALTYDSANALGLMSPVEAELLAQFLDPETAGETPTSPPAAEMTPLLFRLYEAVGAPLPTRSLPREFAVADLRGTAGWKAEIEAAERLARTGALPANRLLGLYTDREPAASGGVWDRVAAIQAFDAAMGKGDAEEIAQTLPAAWEAMRSQRLEVAFATLYGEPLSQVDLNGEAQEMAFRIALLSPAYETAAATIQPAGDKAEFLLGVARGAPDPDLARGDAEQAVASAFLAEGASSDHLGMLQSGRLGQAILTAALQLDAAGPNQTDDITAALSTLRAVGLEGVARRAALQILLLKGSG